MSTPRFTWTTRAWPVLQIGIGDSRIDQPAARWDVARWDNPTALWSGLEPIWLDLSCEAFSFRCEYGRQRLTDRYVPGQASVVVRNLSGWADPSADVVPGELTMRPGRAIRVGVQHVTLGLRWLFRGFIDAMTPTYLPDDYDRVEFSCIDALGEVNRAKLSPVDPPIGASDTVAVRISRVLDGALWPTDKRDLTATGDTLIESDLGGQVADLLGQAADSGGGSVFGDLDANVVYRPRDWQTFAPGTPPDGTIGNVEPGHVIPGTPQVDGYLSSSAGTVSTPDTTDMAITGPYRLSIRMRVDALTGTGFPTPVYKANGGREHMIYAYPPAQLVSYSTAGATSANVDIIIAQASAGNLHYGTVQTFGIEIRPGSTSSVSIVDGVRTPQTTGVAPTPPNTTAPLVLGAPNGAGIDGRIYWAQLERLAVPGYLTPDVGTVSTPDPGPLPNDFTLSYRATRTSVDGGTVAGQWDTWGQLSWLVRRFLPDWVGLSAYPDGTATSTTTPALPPIPGGAAGTDETNALAVTINDHASTPRTRVTAWSSPDQGTTWSAGTPNTNTVTAPFDSTDPVRIGGGLLDPSVNWKGGRIYWAELRTGLDPTAGTVLWRFDANDYPGTGTSYVDPRGRTWTLTSAAAITPKIVAGVVWRFDANDYPGTGTSYVDPRGRTWTLSAPGVITPKIPAVPDVVVPADVCPVAWERPFARADLATRVIIGRDTESAQVLNDDPGQVLYGIEPFERTDLLTERDDKITLLGERILRIRSAQAAPRIRSVSLDARTDPAALDLMATVDVFKPSRYRCRLHLDRGTVFDAEHFATAVVHEMTADAWTLALNLDLAAPFAAAGGRWDGALWDQATWAS